MLKKTTAIILIMILTLSISSPAYAALPDESQTTPRSVEEILNDHHTKIFELENQPAASTYSRSTVTEESITQDTLSELHSAGYEAYNVTASNYDTLEAELQTDFASMGLNPDGSYIVVISGEDQPDDSSVAPADALLPPHTEGGSSTAFTYTYNGTIYTMRYVTVTPEDNSQLGQTSDKELLEDLTDTQRANALNYSLTLLSYVPNLSTTTTILSLISSALPNASSTVPSSLDYTACSSWTTTYTQVYHTGNQEWKMSACVESLTSQYWIDYYYFDPSTQLYDRISTNGLLPTLYSTYYTDKEYMKQIAAYAFESNATLLDIIEEAVYKYNGKVVITHQRWSEYWGYEPT